VSEAVFNYSAIVLAGGRSTRMGVDKASVRVGGRRLLDRVLSVLADLFDDVVVVGRGPDALAPAGVRFVEDETPGLGPLGGLHTGLGVIRNPRALTVGCDMPFLTAEVVHELLEQDGAADATVAHLEGRAQPLLAVYARRVRPTVARLLASNDRSLMALLRTLNVHYVDIQAHSRACLSINTPEDLRQAEHILELEERQPAERSEPT